MLLIADLLTENVKSANFNFAEWKLPELQVPIGQCGPATLFPDDCGAVTGCGWAGRVARATHSIFQVFFFFSRESLLKPRRASDQGLLSVGGGGWIYRRALLGLLS